VEAIRFNRYLGIEVERPEPGEARARMTVASHHRNGVGDVHGGVIASLLDTAMGIAVISVGEGSRCLTTSLTVQFMENVRDGTVEASGRVVRRGRRVAFTEGEVRDSRGRLIATAQGVFHLAPASREVAVDAAPRASVTTRDGSTLRVGKILAVGRNYAAHIDEMGGQRGVPPVLFLKPPTAIVADGGTVRLPAGLGEVHHEVELVVVIGKSGRAIPEAQALDHVLGYAVGLDMTLRDVQAAAKAKGDPWTLSKGFDTSAPVSAVVGQSEAGDGSGLGIRLDVNGKRRQEANTSSMIHSVAALVAFASKLITLEPGDLIFTGTPAGVGPVQPGDVLEASIDRVGSLRVSVAL
jgi:uncharacterized protein (TIGR00369 family)